ncbi:MAG: RdgB/HAM1 family non-canonical purine NTP pyrophosphatase [Bacteroidetes bacterium]|nr:RdgB/HAM1 family non-canonical purine NTP pyrophosphatase [Bacteroidota bacterium]
MPSKSLVKWVISTRNKHKVDEIHAILTELGPNLLSLEAFPGAPDVIEDAETLEGNAAKKSETLFAFTGLPTIADDTGLEVISLGGAPGVHSARFAGPVADDAANRARLLRDLSHVDDRRAQFRTVIAFSTSQGTLFFEGVCEGVITREERGTGGFGYDSLFQPIGFNVTFAEMNSNQKNAISHRGRALRQFADHLKMADLEAL